MLSHPPSPAAAKTAALPVGRTFFPWTPRSARHSRSLAFYSGGPVRGLLTFKLDLICKANVTGISQQEIRLSPLPRVIQIPGAFLSRGF